MNENGRKNLVSLEPVQLDQETFLILQNSQNSKKDQPTPQNQVPQVLPKKKFDFASLLLKKINLEDKQQFENLVQDSSDEEIIDEKPNFKEAIFFVEQKSLTKSCTFQTSYKILVQDRRSLFIFSDKNILRKIAVNIVTNQIFENFIVSLILASTIAMLLQDPSDKDLTSQYSQTLDKVQFGFVIFFIIECVLKIVAMGFIIHENAYLRDSWNWIDFVVVIFAIVELLPIGGSVSLRPLRAFRILRPLKTIKSFPAMRMLISGIIQSIPALINALIFMVFILTQFAILGTLLFGGNYYQRCRTTETAVDEIWPYDQSEERLCSTDPTFGYQCPEGMTCGAPNLIGLSDSSDPIINMVYIDYGFTNFNNLITSLLTIFQIMTKEGWTSIMYNIMDTDRSWMVCPYFIFLVVIAAFFLLNLVVAILSDSLGNYEEKRIIEDDNQKMKIARSVLRKQGQLKGEELIAFKKALDLTIKTSDTTTFDKLEKAFKKKLGNTYSPDPSEIPQTERKLLHLTEAQEVVDQIQEIKITESGEFNSFLMTEKVQPCTATGFEQTNLRVNFKQHEQPGLEKSLDYAIKNESLSHDQQEQVSITGSQKNSAQVSKINGKLEPEVEPQDNISNENSKIVSDKQSIKGLKNRLQYYCFKVCSSESFNMFFTFLVIANFIVLCLDRFPQSLDEEYAVSVFNEVLTFLFLIEMIIRLGGLGLKHFVKDPINLLDAIIVCISIVDIIIDFSSADDIKGLVIFFRAVRVLRILRLARSWQSFKTLLAQIISSLEDILNFTLLMSIFFIIFMVLGMEFFSFNTFYDENGMIVDDGATPPERNFDNIFNAFVTVFSVMIGDNWNNLMYDFARIHGAGAQLYFITLTIVVNIVLLNLLLAILLDRFSITSDEESEEKGVIERQKESFKKFLFKIGALKKKDNEPKKVKVSKEQKLLSLYTSDLQLLNQGKANRTQNEMLEQPSQLNKKSSTVLIASSDLAAIQNKQKTILVELSGKSLWLFGPTNKLRLICRQITQWDYFETASCIVILISTINMVIYNPLNDPDSTLAVTSNYIDYVLASVFTLEALLLIITNGFILNGDQSYIRQGWNILDFSVVVISLIYFAIPGQSKILKTMRLTRLLRPLRLVQKHRGLKIVVESLIGLVPAMTDLILETAILLCALTVIGVNFFKGAFYNCQMDNISAELQSGVNTYWDCLDLGGEWVRPDSNFDNIFEGFKTQFGMMTTDGWYDVYFHALQSTSYYQMPIPNNNKSVFIYFVISMVVTALFLLNMFVGVVVSTFMIQKESLKHNTLLTQQETEYINACTLCYKSQPIVSYKETGCWIKDFCHKFTVSKYFQNFILACVVVTSIILILGWYGASSTQLKVLEILNNILTLIFTLEFLIKIIGLGFGGYFKDSWNKLDFICIFFSWIDFLVTLLAGNNMVGALKVIRLFRVLRFMKLIGQFKDQKVIMMTFFNALPELSNVGGILLLCIFLYSVMGVYLFATVKLQENINYLANFQSFPIAFLTIIRASTGEGWNTLMEDLARERSIHFMCDDNQTYQEIQENGIQGCGQSILSYIYLHSFTLLVSFVLLNNFIAIILEEFSRQLDIDDQLFQPETIDEFCNQWTKYDPDATGLIEVQDLGNLIISLVQHELAIQKQRNLKKKDKDGNIFFNFHKKKLLTLYTNWKLQSDDGSQQYQDVQKNKQMQRLLDLNFNRFIGTLQIPTYNKLKHYQFNDVLQSFTQFTFSQKFSHNYHQRQNRIKLFLETKQELNAFDKITPGSKEYNELSVRARLRVDELNYPEFNDVIFMIEQRNRWVDGNIYCLDEMQSLRRSLRKKSIKQLDCFGGHIIDSSKVNAALLIQHYLREKIVRREALQTQTKCAAEKPDLFEQGASENSYIQNFEQNQSKPKMCQILLTEEQEMLQNETQKNQNNFSTNSQNQNELAFNQMQYFKSNTTTQLKIKVKCVKPEVNQTDQSM